MTSLKSSKEIEIMRGGGKRLAEILKKLQKSVKAGIATQKLEELARELILKYRAEPSFLNFEGYPAVLCTSINEEIVHVLPSKRELKEGDILSLDLGIYWRGYHADMAITIPIGKISSEKKRLIRVTKKALKIGIEKAKIGNTIGDIGNTTQRYVESQGLNVVRELCGHGIGKRLHEEPKILNFGKKGQGEKIKEGMVFCIEPMVSIGTCQIEKSKDGYGYKTKDNSLSCHFEHEVAITKRGPLILTKT